MGSSAAEMAAEVAAEAASSDGPVMSLMSKRLRALRKKYNRILQMEERVAQGKPLEKEQEEVLRSKPAVTTLIDEYEKLRLPLSSALHDEISRLSSAPLSPPKPSDPDTALDDLIGLLYFAYLFDVKPQAEFTATMLARSHERSCCLTYDYVTDEATDMLGERDLDAISSLGALVTSRPVSSGVPHKNALRECVEHAKLWLRSSDQPIHPSASVTYAELRQKLNKIMASDYLTTTPEMKAPVDMAAVVGKYNSACQVQVPESTTLPALAVQKKEDEQENLQAAEVIPDQYSPVDETPEDEADMLNPSGDITSSQQEQHKSEADVEEQSQRDFEQQEQQNFPRRGHQNQRGGSRGGGRRGYPNGRGGGGGGGGTSGGRGGRGGGGGGGGYQNGRSQYYDPSYAPRNYYNTRGRGGRSGGPAMYNHGAATTHGVHVPANAE